MKPLTLDEAEELAMKTDYAFAAVGEEINKADAGAFFLEGYQYACKQHELQTLMNPRFVYPTDKQFVQIAILLNDGKVEIDKLVDMIGYARIMIDRLYEHGSLKHKSSKE